MNYVLSGIMFDLLFYISLAECKQKMLQCDNYGYGLDIRRIAKGLSTKEETVHRHKDSYDWWLDLYSYKLMRGEGYHPPLYLIEPTWEQEKAYEWWRSYFSFLQIGAKSNERSRSKEE